MAEGGLRFAKDGKLSKTLMKIWGQDQLERLWIELIQMEITSPTIVDGQLPNNRQKLKEVQLTLIVKTAENHAEVHRDMENATHVMNTEGEIIFPDQKIQQKLKD